MPCVQAEVRRKHQAYIQQNRRYVDPFAGLSDPVDVILVAHEKRPYDELVKYVPLQKPLREVYVDLDQAGVDRLLSIIIESVSDERHHKRDQLLLELTAYTQFDITDALMALVASGQYYPALPFIRANQTVIRSMLQACEVFDNHALCALAWCDSPEVVQQFASWQDGAPAWQNQAYVPAHSYSQEAGWTVTEVGQRRNLFLKDCWPLLKKEVANSQDCCELGVSTQTECPQCGNLLTDLFVVDMDILAVSGLQWPHDKLHMRTCLRCTAYGEVFMHHGVNDSIWFGAITRQEFDEAWDPIPRGCLVMSSEKRGFLEVANQFLPGPYSQIGGLPTWIQDSAYLKCPGCNKPMTFVGQVDVEDASDYGEGIYYGLVCGDCAITATTYQCT